jgi:3-dehydroquinate synthase
MGTGKTETAKELAELLALEFMDTDALVERLAGCSIAEIIAEKGEAHFRALEAEVCERLYGRRGVVIATGGGTLLNEEIFQAFSNSGTTVLLEASIDSLHERLAGDDSRPLLVAGGGGRTKAKLLRRIRSLLEDRERMYKNIRFRIDTSRITPHTAACRIASRIDLPSAVYSFGAVGNPGRSASLVEVGRGILSKIGERLKEHGLAEDVVLFMPASTRKHFLAQIETSLELAGIRYHLISIEDGEAHKTFDQVGRILDGIVEIGAGRDCTIVPVGGGVTGDIGGFAASIYMRGVHLVHVPTTLLAQVDSSIGGKTGVDHPRAKNLIGGFHQPDLVLSDPCALRTLPLEQISYGMAEVIKTALIGSSELFEFIESELASKGDRALQSVDFLERCVTECIAIKGAIVGLDPFEKDKRRILNLGHTVGHALEAASGYEMNHGQAVALGLIAALEISAARGMVERDLLERTIALLDRCGLPVLFPRIDEEAFFGGLRLDKKRKLGRIHFVLPVGMGGVKIVDDVTADEISSAISRGRK